MTHGAELSVRIPSTWKSWLVLAVLAACALEARAEGPPASEPVKLTLEQAVKIGLARQPALAGAHASRNATYTQKEAADSFLANLSGPQIHIRRKQAEFGVAIAQAGVELAELETTQAVTRTYLAALYAQEQLEVARGAASHFELLEKNARRLVDAGSKEITTSDVQRIAVYRGLADARVNEATAGIDRAKAALREAMGLPCGTPITLEDKLTYSPVHISRCCAIEVALKYRPDYAQALLLANVIQLEEQAQGLTMHSYARTFAATSDIHARILPAGVINGDYRPGPLGPEMPTFLAGSRQSRQQRARDLYERAVAVTDKARGLIVLEVEETLGRMQEYAAQRETYRNANEEANKLAEKARDAFRNDQLTAEKMLTAEVLAAQTRASLNEATYKYASALANLHRATGGHFWDCVVEPPVEKLPKPPMEKASGNKPGK